MRKISVQLLGIVCILARAEQQDDPLRGTVKEA
jgi:hypothetical protein